MSEKLLVLILTHLDQVETPVLRQSELTAFPSQEINITALIRHKNGIHGTGFENYHGLIPLGQKVIDGIGTVDVYLSLPNYDETAILSRFHRLEIERGAQKAALLTPRGLPLSPEGRRILGDIGVTK
ncbi:MAG: hypothetical protein HZB37_10745 [Planctomycetes bacterium]|nr:hypothetical protein [Planctomycetota bacterium]